MILTKQTKQRILLAIIVLLFILPAIFSQYLTANLIFGIPESLLFWYGNALLLAICIYLWSRQL